MKKSQEPRKPRVGGVKKGVVNPGDNAGVPDPDDDLLPALDYLGDPERPEQLGIAAVFDRIRIDIAWLHERAKKKQLAAFNRLVDAIVCGTQAIKDLTDGDADSARKVAAARSFWPISISTSARFPQDQKQLIKMLALDKQGELPFDVFKRFSNRANSPARGLVAQALLFAYAYRRIRFFTSRALGLRALSTEFEELQQMGEVPGDQVQQLPRMRGVCGSAGARMFRNAVSFGNHAESAFAKLIDLLDVKIPEGEQTRGSLSITLLNHNLPPVVLKFPPLPVNEPIQILPLTLKRLLDDILNLPAPSKATKDSWAELVVRLICVPCGSQPLRSRTVRSIGGSGADKSYVQAAGGNHEQIAAMKKKGGHKKSPDTNVLDVATTILLKAVGPLLREYPAENT